MRREDFDINKLIKEAEGYYPRFYEEFVLSFDSIESMEVSIKLAINIESNEYKYNLFNSYSNYYEYYYNYRKIIRDLAINYGIYKDEEKMGEDFYEEFKRDVTEHCEPKMWEECSNINSYLSKEWGSWSLWNFFIKDYFNAYLAECQDNKNQSK